MSGLDPDQVFSETTAAMPGTGLISWALNYKVDRARKDVTVTLLGGGQSHAVYREGLGCYVAHDDATVDASLPPAASQAQPRCCRRLPGLRRWNLRIPNSGSRSIAPSRSPISRRFATPTRWSCSRTAASSPSAMRPAMASIRQILGYSATKSVISALTGILVRQGKLAVHEPAPVAAWQKPR